MLTQEVKTYIQDIITRRAAISSMQDQVKDDIAALAEKLNMKPAALSRAIALVEKELSKGGVLDEQHVIIDMAESLSND